MTGAEQGSATREPERVPEILPAGSDAPSSQAAVPQASATEETEPEATTSKLPASPWRHLAEWAVVVVFAALLAVGLRAFVLQTFYVPSGSMLPTLQIGDRIMVIKVGYTIRRGDIIVFRRTPADTSTTDADLVKRVVGLPGETISSRGDTVLIDGKPIKEPWLPPLTTHMTSQGLVNCGQGAFGIPPTRIPARHYFVMGDCRGDSDDSRAWGTVPSSYIVGRVVLIVWRFGKPYFHAL